MRNGNIRSLQLLATLAGLAVSNVWAADAGFYFGLNAGVSDFDARTVARQNAVLGRFSSGGNPGTFVPGPVILISRPVGSTVLFGTTRSDVDQRDFTFSASVGYAFNRFLSVELSYADLGELTNSQITTFQSSDVPIVGTPVSLRSTQELSAETVSISVLGTLPLSERWSLFARGGYGYSESEAEFRTAFSLPGAQVSRFEQDFDSEDYVLGAGVGFKLSTRFSLRADYERLFEAGAEFVDVDRFGLSAIYRL